MIFYTKEDRKLKLLPFRDTKIIILLKRQLERKISINPNFTVAILVF